MIASLQLFFIDIGVIDTINIEAAQGLVVWHFQGLVVLEAERFKEVHVDDRRAGGDDGVNHAVLHHVAIDMHTTASAGRAGQGQPDRSFLVCDHGVENLSGATGVAAGEGHFLHAIDDGARIIGRDIYMLDDIGEKFCFAIYIDGFSHSLGTLLT